MYIIHPVVGREKLNTNGDLAAAASNQNNVQLFCATEKNALMSFNLLIFFLWWHYYFTIFYYFYVVVSICFGDYIFYQSTLKKIVMPHFRTEERPNVTLAFRKY